MEFVKKRFSLKKSEVQSRKKGVKRPKNDQKTGKKRCFWSLFWPPNLGDLLESWLKLKIFREINKNFINFLVSLRDLRGSGVKKRAKKGQKTSKNTYFLAVFHLIAGRVPRGFVFFMSKHFYIDFGPVSTAK